MDESTLSPEEQKERKIMKLLLKIKNGTPPMRKVGHPSFECSHDVSFASCTPPVAILHVINPP